MQLLRSLLEISQRNHFGADHEVVQYRPGQYLVRYNGDFQLQYYPDVSGKYSNIDVHWDGHWFYASVPDVVSALSDKSQVIHIDAEHPELSGERAQIQPNSQEAKWLFDFYRRVVQPVSQGKQPEDGISMGESVGAVQFAKQNGSLESAPGKVIERVVNTPDVTNGNKTAKIHYNTELMQYRVRLYVDGKFETDSEHFEDSPKDALKVARKMVGLVK